MMDTKLLGNTGLAVTPVGFGVLTVGNTQLNLSVADGAAILRYALDCGINFLDTAQYYQTYPYIKTALKGLSFDPVICSKCLDPSFSGMEAAIEEARKEMDRDVIDIFLLHEVRSAVDLDLRKGALECLLEAKEKGLVRAVGVSTHHVDVAEAVAQREEFDVLFPLINFQSLGIRKGLGPGTKEEMAEAILKASRNGQGVFTMKVFGGGPLIAHYQEAIRYVRSLPGVDSMMMGFGSFEEVDRIFEVFEDKLDPSYMPDISQKKIWIDQGDCEGCGICLSRCPNQAIYRNEEGRAAVKDELCMTCGYCAPVCPVRAIIMISR